MIAVLISYRAQQSNSYSHCNRYTQIHNVRSVKDIYPNMSSRYPNSHPLARQLTICLCRLLIMSLGMATYVRRRLKSQARIEIWLKILSLLITHRSNILNGSSSSSRQTLGAVCRGLEPCGGFVP